MRQPTLQSLQAIVDLTWRKLHLCCQFGRSQRTIGIEQQLQQISLAGRKECHNCVNYMVVDSNPLLIHQHLSLCDVFGQNMQRIVTTFCAKVMTKMD
jgi:hypothetical protein